MAGQTAPRSTSIDLLRGIVMVIMALDHVRDYFHADSFISDPTDLATTTVPFFLTRWITHYCAPIFVFLSGTSAWIVHQRMGTKATSLFLLKRGLWLIVVEIVLIRIGWTFNPTLLRFGLQVIWAIGASMVVLSALIHLPWRAILVVGLVLVFGHNALDGIHFDGAWWWKMLHDQGRVEAGGLIVFFAYPLLPWIGTMALGYCFGTFYGASYSGETRRRALTGLGLGAILLFMVVRWTNLYGDMEPWAPQGSAAFTVLSFLNLTKYPPSLLYLLMTLGPAMLFLAWSENIRGWLARALIVFGRVPFFYYVLHLYLIHAGAMLAAQLTGFGWQSMVTEGRVNLYDPLKGYGFSLPVTYLVWIAVVLALYPLCKWFDRVKSSNRQIWWLRYL